MDNGHSYLDKVRITDGIDKCKAVFHEIYKKNGWRVIELLNDRRITFPCLFALLGQIESLGLYRYLSSRNITALKVVEQILKPRDLTAGINYLSSKKNEIYSALKWMLESGSAEDGINNEYEKILDVIASVLINLYRDRSILPVVTDMIFKRNRKGHYIHDLVWALTRIRDPYVLRLIAEHIRSSDNADVELACSLLNIEMPDTSGTDADRQRQYESYLRWLEENDPFLYFTEESFQFASNPALCRVDLERKYMCKGTASYDREPVTPSDEDEGRCLEAFKPLSDEDKTVLSEYSYKIRNKSASEWKEWMRSPVGEQLKTARAGLEGAQ